MSWHGYTAGQQVPVHDVVERCERYVSSGSVVDRHDKDQQLQRIRECGYDVIVYSPTEPKGWGSSPLNPNNWRTVEGKSIYEEQTE
jgi:hypothetical protein